MPKFVPRQRKHRALARQRESDQNGARHADSLADSNTLEVLPSVKDEQVERKRKLRDELRTAQPNMSSKKQKRLDKYIDKKIRKDDTIALIKRLEGKHKSVDTSLLQSAKSLGRNKETRREEFTRALAEREKGIRVKEADAVLYSRPTNRVSDVETAESNNDDVNDEEEGEGSVDQELPVLENASDSLLTTIPKDVSTGTNSLNHGSGLKRPLELDEEGRPIIKKRKRSIKTQKTFHIPKIEAESMAWTGFSDAEESTTSVESEAAEVINEDDLSDVEGSISDHSSSHSNIELDSDVEKSTSPDEENSIEDENDDEYESDESDTTKTAKKARTSAFKAWAEQQRNDTIGFKPSTVIGSAGLTLPVVSEEVKKAFTPREPEQEPLPESFATSTDLGKDRKAYAVPVHRSEDIQTARLALPVLAEEQRIMEAVFNNDVVIVSGATGSGKTTQVPQFLFEYGFGDQNGPTPGMIGVTQPRRVAAVSMAKRVGEELGDCGKRAAHQIRFDTTVGRNTAIKFMTDGVLLREMSEDFSLRKYSAIIIDEAHERTVNTDILISLMSRCIRVRRQLTRDNANQYSPLKLVIMSATLRVSDFRNNARLFSTPPPLIEAEGRQYDVNPHWSRKTTHDYIEEAFKKVSRGHRKLPPGGILVFLTGQNEIRTLMRRLKEEFPSTSAGNDVHPQMRVSAAEMTVEAEDLGELTTVEHADDDKMDDELDIVTESEDEDLDAEFTIEGEDAASGTTKLHILPLYSQLPSKEQLRVFEGAPEGSRLVVLATNIAETSLTIPGIRYVFDSGRHKERLWDRAGVQTFKTTWISKASADQRMGRAGRTGPGHCYRLYSSAIYESAMPEFAQPEIYRSPLESVVLQLKAMNIGRVDNFPFPTAPDRRNLVKAERLLKNLGALDNKGKITSLGKELQNYPLNPRFALMLRLGVQYGVAKETIAAVAALDVPEIIISQNMLDISEPQKGEDEIWTHLDDQAEAIRKLKREAYNNARRNLSRLDFDKRTVRPQADALKFFAAAMDYANATAIADDEKAAETFCKENFLREKGMREVEQLRHQLSSMARTATANAGLASTYDAKLKKPSEKTMSLLKQIIAKGYLDQIAMRADLLPNPPLEERKAKYARDVKYKTLFTSHDLSSKTDEDGEKVDPYVYTHPSSVLSTLPVKAMPKFIVYQRLQRGQSSRPGVPAKIRMHPLTPLSADQIAAIARDTSLLEVGKPSRDVKTSLGEDGKERRECEVPLSLVGDDIAKVGWPLVRKNVLQKRVPGEGWVVEKWLD